MLSASAHGVSNLKPFAEFSLHARMLQRFDDAIEYDEQPVGKGAPPASQAEAVRSSLGWLSSGQLPLAPV